MTAPWRRFAIAVAATLATATACAPASAQVPISEPQAKAVSAADTRGCHVVFIAETEEWRVVPILRALADQLVLTVSDADGFVDLGGGIGLVSSDERLQFEVNRGALEQAQLKASANLLKLARNILETRTRN